MRGFRATLGVLFASGCFGGLINGLAVWIFGVLGITAALGVKIAPALTPGQLYPRIVWGGLWGFLFVLPIFRRSIFWQGLILSLGPTIIQLFIVFPLKAKKGALGLELGYLTPVFVLLFNAVWGWAASYWLACSKNSKK